MDELSHVTIAKYGLTITKLNHISCVIHEDEIIERTCHASKYFDVFLKKVVG